MRKIIGILVGTALTITAAPVSSETLGFNLSAYVPVTCRVGYQSTGASAAPQGGIPLGVLREYCNAPSGYQLVVSYTPGTLRGAIVIVGEDQVTLNGSGEAVLSRALGPKWRNRPIAAVPGEAGFDTETLVFNVQPS